MKNYLTRKPKLVIITESIRPENHLPLKYFRKFKVVHFYLTKSYVGLDSRDLKGAIHFQSIRDLWHQLKLLMPNVIQIPEPYASRNSLKLALTGYLFARRYRTPYFLSVWETRPTRAKFGPLLSPILKGVLGLFGKGALIVFAINKDALANLKEAQVARSKIIQNFLWGLFGVDIREFTPLGPKANLSSFPTVYFTGRIDEAKGIPYLLKAFHLAKSKIPNLKLVIQGKGELEYLAEGKDITKLSWTKQKNLPAYFRAATVTVHPSITLKRWSEQVGLVILQSLSCGCPVISTFSGGIPDYLPHKKVGLLVPEKNAQALAKAIIKIVQNKQLRNKMSREARKYIIQNFDLKKNVALGEEILWQALYQSKN